MVSIDRHVRAAIDGRGSRIGLLIVLAAAAVLRLWRLADGVPFSVGVDEPEIMNRVVIMMKTGDFNPHFFDYPGLYLYLQLIVAVARFLAGAAAGYWASLAQVSPADFYVWARAVTAIAGTATVWLVYRAGLRWGTGTALLASALMAVMPLHVRESHYVLTDVPQTLFVTATLVLSLRASERRTRAAFAAAGVMAGFAAATKYTGASALLLPLLASWFAAPPGRSRGAAAATVCGACAIAFLVAAPYTILDLPGFLNGFGHLTGAYTGPAPGEAPAITYLKHLRNGLGWGAGTLAIAGLLLASAALVAGPNRARWMLLVPLPLVYFAFISRQSLVFGRYLLPIVPFVTILAAIAVMWLVSVARAYELPRPARGALAAAAILLLLARPAAVAIQFDRQLSQTSTTELAYAWIRANVPPGTKLVIETTFLVLPPEYTVEHVHRGMLTSYEDYASRGVRFVVLSSDVYRRYLDARNPEQQEYLEYVRLFGRAREVARFTPAKDRPGPEVRILDVMP